MIATVYIMLLINGVKEKITPSQKYRNKIATTMGIIYAIMTNFNKIYVICINPCFSNFFEIYFHARNKMLPVKQHKKILLKIMIKQCLIIKLIN